MAAYTDQDEVEKLKVWWKTYGGALLLGVLIGLALLFGNKYWSQHKESQRVAASDLYAQMVQQMQAKKTDAARANGEKLVKEYDGTPYAGMAALMLARLSFETNDVAGAQQRLEWAMANATDAAVVHTARLRLARLHLTKGEYDQALALAKVDGAAGFEAEYLELKGDVLLAQGKNNDARAAYQEALSKVGVDTPSHRLLSMKLDDIGQPQP
ncbi:MAG: tetratricopeptide repeat protein [Gammaproteobacteria bacterium]|nr:tetratricopeptide repeat protein [Gammaproteobacteria bacterium]